MPLRYLFGMIIDQSKSKIGSPGNRCPIAINPIEPPQWILQNSLGRCVNLLTTQINISKMAPYKTTRMIQRQPVERDILVGKIVYLS